ncbi:MAG TPA: MOSC domain-containing protein [Planctomicrobium sp.]|nr:MOSC domain-containing protein [Planctomicrobium sp.]
MKAAILSIQVGRPRQFATEESVGDSSKPWCSAIVKQTVTGKVFVDFTNINGDEQADLKHHGGADKAVLGYAAGHYPAWNSDLPEIEFPYGGFGENLTLSGIDESTCCIGDVYAIGECRLQISQPRQPCWKLSRRWNIPNLAVLVQKTGRTGWYFRVLTPGAIESGMPLTLVDRPFPQFTVSRASDIMHAKLRDRTLDLELAACPALSASWKTTLIARATQGQEKDSRPRLFGG